MKRWSVWIVMLSLVALTSAAQAATIGLGVFGGSSVPVVQDDNGQGTIFGVRASVNLVPLITVEPYYAKTNGGDKDQTLLGTTYTRHGIDLTSYGVNALLTFGTGLQLYPFAGIGSTKATRDGLDATTTQYNFGLGLGFKPPVLKLSVNLRGELDTVLEPDNSQTARKWANVTLGVSYGIVSFPPVP